MTLSLNVAAISSCFKGKIPPDENALISPLPTVKSVEVVLMLQLHTFDLRECLSAKEAEKGTAWIGFVLFF